MERGVYALRENRSLHGSCVGGCFIADRGFAPSANFVDFDGNRVCGVHDFLFARYAMEGVAILAIDRP